ncbi:MAG: hypothetical protein HQM10_05390 [Candidatus Riflebacteria bacterium]|nr:hypothetical protein [Candidatus Riflebacteria bacterium]
MSEAIKRFPLSEKLFSNPMAFQHDSLSDILFENSMKEALIWHYLNCRGFAAFMSIQGFNSLKSLDSIDKCEKIPPLFVNVFKEFRLISIPEEKIKLELTSSGTGGKKSAVVLDEISYNRILKAVSGVFSSLGLRNDEEEVNYICFAYDPKYAADKGTTFSDKQLTYLTKRKDVYYAIRWNKEKSDFEFNPDQTVKKLLKFSVDGPVRLLGFPAYLWQICEILEKKGIRLHLGDRSFIITGGGWKVFKNREVRKEVFKEKIEEILGIPQKNIRDSYGLVEHGIPYLECEHGRMHVPIYSRARVVDPETLFPFPDGTEGLLHLMTPFLTSYPSLSVLTTDKAILENNCPCGLAGKTLKITGRAGLSKNKGCAISALEYIKKYDGK